MIDREHDLPITKQAQVLRISRGSVYYLTRPMPEADLAIMRRLDRLHLEFPFAGSRMCARPAGRRGARIGRRHAPLIDAENRSRIRSSTYSPGLPGMPTMRCFTAKEQAATMRLIYG